jgi:hypothetical protein
VIGRSASELGLRTPDADRYAEIMRASEDHGSWEGYAIGRRADGSTVPLPVLLERVEDPEIDFSGIVYASFTTPSGTGWSPSSSSRRSTTR